MSTSRFAAACIASSGAFIFAFSLALYLWDALTNESGSSQFGGMFFVVFIGWPIALVGVALIASIALTLLRQRNIALTTGRTAAIAGAVGALLVPLVLIILFRTVAGSAMLPLIGALCAVPAGVVFRVVLGETI